MAPRYFVTGTDTEVGKTVATVQLIRLLNQQKIPTIGMKPAASGCLNSNGILINDDVVAHQNATPIAAPLALVSPYRFEPAISPHIAAREADIEIKLPHILSCAEQLSEHANTVVVEGAGGWFAPLSDTHTIADLAIALEAPVILVVGMRLGCINHAMLTAQAIKFAGLPIAGWIANQIDPHMSRYAENLAYLQTHLSAPFLAEIPHSSNALNSCLNIQAFETLKLRNN
ncbi:dethiobiotin synthase [Chitinibacter bivalviorum]|uniref:ATP-dependent dethiobiotin synthetase BioD n=1 Tax=Chitinibacter bivalviorum TaxID=2739434 RepID=A0A7H9BM82_9NEIS|nr:dethiobiotin synthase [Chitinibacter bivalviorum]